MQPSDRAALSVSRKLRKAASAATLGGGLVAVVLWSLAAATFVPDEQPTGWVSRPAMSSTDLRSDNEVIYRAD